MIAVILQIVTVVERQLLPRPHVAQSHDPNLAVHLARFAIGLATVIEPTRRVPIHVPIEVELVIQMKYGRHLRLEQQPVE